MIPFPNALTSEPAWRIQTSRESCGSRLRRYARTGPSVPAPPSGQRARPGGHGKHGREKIDTVYVSVTRVRTGDLPPEASTIVAEEVDKWLREIAGFEGFVMLTRDGSSVAMSFWKSREVADRHRLARMQIRERVTALAGAEIDDVAEYEIAYARLGPLSIEPDA
jgi:hypothetical protein